MLKYVILMTVVVCLVEGQRPPYAGTSNRYPVVLPRFREDQENASGSGLGNRIDAGIANSIPTNPARPVAAFAPASSSSSTIPEDLPIDAHGDIDLVNRIKTWPREKQPFWYINWRQIQEHRGNSRQTNQQPANQQ